MTSLIDNTEYDKLLWMESYILNVSQTEFSRPKVFMDSEIQIPSFTD